jgi:Mn-dependent DtxR family transcriptional regulator
VLSKFLTDLGVNEQTAEEDACRIEHIISDDAFDVIKKHINSKD